MGELLVTYLLQSTLILGAALLLTRLPGLRTPFARDVLLKGAFVASLVAPWGVHAPAEVPMPSSRPLATATSTPSAQPTVPDRATASPNVRSSALATAEGEQPLPGVAALAHLWRLAEHLPWLVLTLALITLGRFARACLQARRLARSGRPLCENWSGSSGSRHLGSTRARGVRILAVDRLDTPLAMGWGTILLPSGISESLAPSEVRAVIAHEVAHIERRDPIWNAALSFVSYTLALQPLNLLALRAWQRASEEVCDATASERCEEPLALAHALIKMAHRRSSIAPAVAMGVATRTHLTRRIETLVKQEGAHVQPHRLVVVAILPLILALLLPVVTSAQPATSLAGMKIILDAGHGGEDPGAQGYANESDVVLAVALAVQKVLTEQGAEVLMTREGEHRSSEPQLGIGIPGWVADSDADMFLSLHTAAATSPHVAGIQTWVGSNRSYANDRRSDYVASHALATALQAELTQRTGTVGRGVLEQPQFGLQDLPMPAVLVELGFVTHPQEGPLLATTAYQEQLSNAIAKALAGFASQFSVEASDVKPVPIYDMAGRIIGWEAKPE